MLDPAADLLARAGDMRFATVLADPPWQFTNRTGKMAPEHRRLARYPTLSLEVIRALPVSRLLADPAHLYLWVRMRCWQKECRCWPTGASPTRPT